MTATRPPITATDLVDAVRSRHMPPEWRLEAEVTLGGRRLDVLAFNLWAARGYRVVGFECKVDRGDWIRELCNFRKAEEWNQVVDDFYLVTPPKLVREGELPDGWGHLELVGTRMMTRRFPGKRPKGTVLPREVVARFFTRILHDQDAAERSADFDLRAELRAKLEADLRAQIERDAQRELDAVRDVRREYDELLKAMGIRRQSWGAHRAALRAAAILAENQDDQVLVRRLEGILESSSQLRDTVSRALDALKALPA